ncbi:MAG: hypothetical protein KGL46_13505 [Hyphomicrobiales bacterium]|nr:hypothetical protein [Hyphomicrobiales bacterium]
MSIFTFIYNLSWPIIGGFCYLIFVAMPLGRRTIRVRRKIPAARADVWRVIDPRQSDFSHASTVERRDVAVACEEPLIVEWRSRPVGSNKPFVYVGNVYTQVEPERRLTSCLFWKGDAAIPEKDLCFETVTLQAERGGTHVQVVTNGPIRGFVNYELHRRALVAYLDNVKRHVCEGATAKAPMIRFAGWRIVLFCILAGLAMFAPMFWYGSANNKLVAIVVPLLLVAVTLLHEMGHAFAMVWFGHRGVVVSLIPFFGGFAASKRAYENKFELGVVSLAGPALCAVAGLMLIPALSPFRHWVELMVQPGETRESAKALLQSSPVLWLGMAAYALLVTSTLLNMFNLMPLKGYDGQGVAVALFSSKTGRLLSFAAVAAVFVPTLGPTWGMRLDSLLSFAIIIGVFAFFGGNNAGADLPNASARQRAVLAGMFAFTLGCFALQTAVARNAIQPLFDRMEFNAHNAAAAPADDDPPSAVNRRI